MDAHGVCALCRVSAIFFLSRVFREFLRWEALRDEGRVAAHSRMHVTAVVPELVPAEVPVCAGYIPLRVTLTPAERIEDNTWLPRSLLNIPGQILPEPCGP